MTASGANPDLVVSIDPNANYAWLDLHIAMTWPRNLQRRQEAKIAFGAAALDETAIEASTTKMTASEIAADVRRIKAEIIKPLGGIAAVARAPSINEIIREMERVRRITNLVGTITCFAAQLDCFHKDLSSSLGRSWAILEAERRPGKIHIPSDRSAFRKTMWDERSCVGPLCAAYVTAISMYGGREDWDVMRPQGDVRDILAWAKWFRRWATTFVPKRSPNKKAFIPDDDAVIYDTDVVEAMPPIAALSPARLQAALTYWQNSQSAN